MLERGIERSLEIYMEAREGINQGTDYIDMYIYMY